LLLQILLFWSQTDAAVRSFSNQGIDTLGSTLNSQSEYSLSGEAIIFQECSSSGSTWMLLFFRRSLYLVGLRCVASKLLGA
jgi:hypothetical protein